METPFTFELGPRHKVRIPTKKALNTMSNWADTDWLASYLVKKIDNKFIYPSCKEYNISIGEDRGSDEDYKHVKFDAGDYVAARINRKLTESFMVLKRQIKDILGPVVANNPRAQTRGRTREIPVVDIRLGSNDYGDTNYCFIISITVNNKIKNLRKIIKLGANHFRNGCMLG